MKEATPKTGMYAEPASSFKHTTLTKHPDKIASVVILEERAGYSTIYLSDPNGGLWPARDVSHKPKGHYNSVCDAWIADYGLARPPTGLQELRQLQRDGQTTVIVGLKTKG